MNIPILQIGSKEDPYPMLGNLWDFFSEKGTKTVIVSCGSGFTALSDLELAETLGSPLLKLTLPHETAKWTEVKEVLKTRKVSDTTSEFAKPATKKWVLPKNLLIEECIPGSYSGLVDIDGSSTKLVSWFHLLENHCKTLGIEQPHIDILKVDSYPYEADILTSLLQIGFRPSLILVNWTESPETSLQTLLPAAHLQMIGYALIAVQGTKCLYYYTDVNYYETCSWNQVTEKLENPFVVNIVKTVFPTSEQNLLRFPKLGKKQPSEENPESK
jgi:hypothetical protein